MQTLTSQATRYSILILVAIVIFVALLGLNLSMPTDAEGRMLNCYSLNTENAMCPMNGLEHIVSWQKMFTVLSDKTLLLLSFLSILIVLFESLNLNILKRVKDGLDKACYLLEINAPLFNYLKVAFSDGILNPKVF